MNSKDCKRNLQYADISLGKLLIALRHIAEIDQNRSRDFNQVVANLGRQGVECRGPRRNGGGDSFRIKRLVPWSILETQLSLAPLNFPAMLTDLNSEDDNKFRMEKSIVMKFIIGKTCFTIGIEIDLFKSVNFFKDVFNLVSYRRAIIEVHIRLRDNRLPRRFLPILHSGDHDRQLVEMHPDIEALCNFVASLCVIVLKVNSAESSSSDETLRSTNEDPINKDLAMWKVWNWTTLNNDYSFSIDTAEHVYNGESLGNSGYYYDMDETMDVDTEDNAGLDSYMHQEERVYTKEVILSLRDSPLSHKKPESLERISAIAKVPYGSHHTRRQMYHYPQQHHHHHNNHHHHPPVSATPLVHHQQDCCCDDEQVVREYSRKFLLSLRYAPLSMRRPSVCTVNSYRQHHNRNMHSLAAQQPTLGAYKQHY